MGSKTRVLYGPESIKDSLGSLSFHISAQAFFQVNSEQAEKLYNKALEFAALSGKETVVDVYCGTGTISLYLARHAKQVYGIEIVAPAIENAKKMQKKINALMRNLSAVMLLWSCRSCLQAACVRTLW